MTDKSTTAVIAALFIALASVPAPMRPAAAQASDEQLEAILEEIDKKSDQYTRFRSLLSDQDQAKRMAAFNAMTSSGIATLQEMALDQAFDSGDPAMQAIALQALLTKAKALTFDLEPSSETSERTLKTISKHGGGFSIEIDQWDPATASFVEAGDPYSGSTTGQGQLSGLSLHYDAKHCRAFAVLDETARNMLGELSCTGFGEPVKVKLAVR
jgi:hypothetical protein